MSGSKCVRIEVAGQVYGSQELKDLATAIVPLRDGALEQNQFQWSVLLSHVIGVLNTVAVEVEKMHG